MLRSIGTGQFERVSSGFGHVNSSRLKANGFPELTDVRYQPIGFTAVVGARASAG
jgi:hypothetical protein